LVTGVAVADECPVPAGLQAALLVKVAAYDTNLPARAGETVRTLVVFKEGSDESVRVSSQVRAALAGQPAIADRPHVEETVAFAGATALAQLCRARRASVVYLAPGFTDEEVTSVVAALTGVDVLSASGVPRHVRLGVVLGFDLVSGKPSLLVNLAQAHKQRVALSANVLRLVTVVP
jgi:hypothetical protein